MELPLHGIIPPMITPVHEDLSLDEKGLQNLVAHLIEGGVHGIFVLGTNGEGPSLSYELRKTLIKLTVDFVKGRVPVLVGITDTSLSGSLDIAHFSAVSGVNALVLAPPYYMPISQQEMRSYLDTIVPKLPLPFVIYNMPSCTKLSLSVDTIKRARDLGAIGIKDSSGDMEFMNTLIHTFKNDPEFALISGTEMFLDETVKNGGHGAVAGGANFFPKLFTDLYHASCKNDNEKVTQLQEVVMRIYNTIYSIGNDSSRFTVATKTMLSLMGICSDTMAPPLKSFNEAQRKTLAAYWEQFKP